MENIKHMHKIGYFQAEEWEKKYLHEHLKKDELEIYSDPLTPETISKYPEITDNDILSIFVQSVVNKKVLDALPSLKFIVARSTGFDHIDMKECKKRGILVSNVPYYGENTVAEQAFALLLTLSRKIVPSVEQTQKGNFMHSPALCGFDLKGKIFGVVGTGHIGTYAIKIAHGFSMNVVAYDSHPNKKLAKEFGFRYVKTLEELLSEADIISLHAPYLKETHHMINAKNIHSIKRGAILINTARGGLVETKALLQALLDGTLLGAGLDVLEEENILEDKKRFSFKEFATSELAVALENYKLSAMENVIITPHNAFNTIEAKKRIIDTSLQNIEAFKKGKPVNLVSSK